MTATSPPKLFEDWARQTTRVVRLSVLRSGLFAAILVLDLRSE